MTLRLIKDILIGAVFIPVAIYVLIAIGSSSSVDHPAANSNQSSLSAGDEGRLHSGDERIPVAVDEEVLPKIEAAFTARDPRAIASLSGRLFYVADGTPVRVSENGTQGPRVRILSGPEKGRLGWVSTAWLKPLGD